MNLYFGTSSTKVKDAQMKNYLEHWSDHIQHELLFSWDKKRQFSHSSWPKNVSVQYTNTSNNLPHGEPSGYTCMNYNEVVNNCTTIQYSPLIVLAFDYVDEKNHNLDSPLPLIINLHNISRHVKDGQIHNDKHPAITIQKITIRWCSRYSHEPYYRPGPRWMQLPNYCEYWNHGHRSARVWDDAILEWDIQIDMKNNFILQTSGPPHWTLVNRSSNPKISNRMKALQELLRNPREPITLLNNKFFNSITDEFRFLDIMKKA
jgi:hypothetical protein